MRQFLLKIYIILILNVVVLKTANCDVFIAPRKKEGIGIATVEAISRGQYIVGFNDSTMNEYIVDEKIGFLFDSKNNKKIKLQNIIDNYKYRIENANFKYNEWNKNKKKIIDFFEEKNELVRKYHFIPLFMIDNLLLKNDIHREINYGNQLCNHLRDFKMDLFTYCSIKKTYPRLSKYLEQDIKANDYNKNKITKDEFTVNLFNSIESSKLKFNPIPIE